MPTTWRSILAHCMEVYTLAHVEVYSCHCTVEETELRASFAAGHRANEWKGYALASSPAWNLVSEGQQRPAVRPIICTVCAPHTSCPTPHTSCSTPHTPNATTPIHLSYLFWTQFGIIGLSPLAFLPKLCLTAHVSRL